MTADADVIDVPTSICDDRFSRCSLRRSSTCFRGLVRRLPVRRRSTPEDRSGAHSTAERTVDRSAVNFDDSPNAQPTTTLATSMHLVDDDRNVGLTALLCGSPTPADVRNVSTACSTQSANRYRRQSGTMATISGRHCRPKLTTLHAFIMHASPSLSLAVFEFFAVLWPVFADDDADVDTNVLSSMLMCRATKMGVGGV